MTLAAWFWTHGERLNGLGFLAVVAILAGASAWAYLAKDKP